MALVLFSFSCQNAPSLLPKQSSGQYNGNPKPHFFDLKAYFQQEIARLKKDVRQVQKTVTTNGQSETQMLTNIDFEKELALFIASDINRPAWTDKYTAQKLTFDTIGYAQVYSLKKGEILKTKQVYLHLLDEKHPLSIRIENVENSLVTAYNQVLSYEAQKGYRIESRQKTAFNNEDLVVIEIIFK